MGGMSVSLFDAVAAVVVVAAAAENFMLLWQSCF